MVIFSALQNAVINVISFLLKLLYIHVNHKAALSTFLVTLLYIISGML